MQNMERLRRSMRRLMLADFDPGELLPCLQVRARAAAPPVRPLLRGLRALADCRAPLADQSSARSSSRAQQLCR